MAKILIVDDELGIRELFSEILTDERHVVETAENAVKARICFDQFAPDIVLLDIWMPDGDGLSLLKEWKNAGKLTQTPVIMMSGHATIDTALSATKLGALTFIEKPVPMQKLLQAIKQALDRLAYLNATVNFEKNKPVVSVAITVEAPPRDAQMNAIPAAFQSFALDKPLKDARDAFEKAYFEFHLIHERFNMTRLAERTGIERTHLYRKLRQLGIESGKAGKRAKQDKPGGDGA